MHNWQPTVSPSSSMSILAIEYFSRLFASSAYSGYAIGRGLDNLRVLHGPSGPNERCSYSAGGLALSLISITTLDEDDASRISPSQGSSTMIIGKHNPSLTRLDILVCEYACRKVSAKLLRYTMQYQLHITQSCSIGVSANHHPCHHPISDRRLTTCKKRGFAMNFSTIRQHNRLPLADETSVTNHVHCLYTAYTPYSPRR